MRRLQRLSAALFAAILTIAAVAQEPPAPSPAPAPPEPPSPRATTPAPRVPRTPRPPRAARNVTPRESVTVPAEEASGQDAFSKLEKAIRLERMIESAAEATGLSAEQVTPAVTALRSLFVPEAGTIRIATRDATIIHKRVAKDGHETYIVRNGPGASEDQSKIEAGEAQLAKAVHDLPAENRDAFEEWANRKRAQISEIASMIAGDVAGVQDQTDEDARLALETVLRAEKDVAKARARTRALAPLGGQPGLDPKRLAELEAQGEALADATKSLERYHVGLADQLARLSRQRIETSLDKSLVDRYRTLLDVDRDASRRTVENMLRAQANLFGETRAGVEGMEQRVAELQAQRQAIDEALERATTDLVRERAQKLEQEAQRRQAKESAEQALRERSPQAQDVQPERGRTPQGDVPPDAYQAEIKRLRDELQNLRKEVEALRRAKEPK